MRLIEKLFGKHVNEKKHQAGTVGNESLIRTMVDSGWKLSSRDEHALSVYERHCKDNSVSANPWDAGTWLKEFRGLDEESRNEQVKARQRSDYIER